MYFGHVDTSFPHLQLLLYPLLPFFSSQYQVYFLKTHPVNLYLPVNESSMEYGMFQEATPEENQLSLSQRDFITSSLIHTGILSDMIYLDLLQSQSL